MHRGAIKLMIYFRNKYLPDMKGIKILDVGSRNLFENEEFTNRPLFEPLYEYVGMDIVPGKNVDIVGFENIKEKFDVVISTSTMEHVNHPWDWLKSLTPYFTKYICIIAPWRWEEHRFPIDTYRYYPDGMRDLFQYAGIKEVEIVMGRTDTMGIGEHISKEV